MKPTRTNPDPAASPANPAPPRKTAPPGGPVPGRGKWWPAAAIGLLTFLAYLPVWRAGFIWDDDSFLTNNPLIKQAGGLFQLWFSTEPPDYFPLTSTTLWLEWRLWGMNPLGYHLVNVLLHALSAVLWWRVFARLKIPGAWLAAAIFALHPVNVESVAWITERKNTLTMVFFVLTLLWFLKFEDTNQRRWYWAAVGAFWLSLLSKTSVVPLPVVLLGLAWWRHGRVTGRDVKRSLPFFVLALVMGLVTVWFQSQRAIGDEIVRTDGWGARLAGAGWGLWFYLSKALLPVNLLFVYPRWQINGANPLVYGPLILFLAALFVCWWQRERWGRGWLFGLGYFLLLLMPVLGFLDIYFMKYSLVADHWQYFAVLGPVGLVAAGAARALNKHPGLAKAGGAGLLLVLGILTGRQCREYVNEETLWRTTLTGNPRSYIAHLNLGAIVLDQAQAGQATAERKSQLVDEAVAHFRAALEARPDDAVAHSNLGTALFNREEFELALRHVRRALEIQPRNARVHTALGNILFAQGQKADAVLHFREAVRLDPSFSEAHYALGDALFQEGRFDEAFLQLKQAGGAWRGLAEVHNRLGQVLQRQGKESEAQVQFQKALKIQPRHANAHNNLGTLFLQTGQAAAAIDCFKAALEIQPDFAMAHYNLGNALHQAGQTEAAIEHLRQAQEIQPDNASAHNNLAGLLLETGRTDEAVAQFEMALKLRPDHAVTRNNLGRALLQQGKPLEAAVQFQEALASQSTFPQAADNLRLAVWVLTTTADDQIRNGPKAVELAQQLGRHFPTNTPLYLGTLAAAYAEARRFSEAIDYASQARKLATNSSLGRDLEAQLALYRAGMSLHDSDRTNSAPAPRQP